MFERDPDRTTDADALHRIAHALVMAYNDRDAGAMGYADDVLVRFHMGAQTRYDNVHDIRDHWRREWTSFPDARLDVRRVVVEGGTFVLESRWQATNTGPLFIDAETAVPPTNVFLERDCVSICDVHDGYITRVDQYWESVAPSDLGITT